MPDPPSDELINRSGVVTLKSGYEVVYEIGRLTAVGPEVSDPPPDRSGVAVLTGFEVRYEHTRALPIDLMIMGLIRTAAAFGRRVTSTLRRPLGRPRKDLEQTAPARQDRYLETHGLDATAQAFGIKPESVERNLRRRYTGQ